MREQILHLIGKHSTTLQIDVLGVCRGEWHGHQLHSNLFWSAPPFMVIASPTRGYHISPYVPPTLADRSDVVASEFGSAKLLSAVQT